MKKSFSLLMVGVVSTIPSFLSASPHGEGHAPGFSSLITPWIAFLLFCSGIFILVRSPALKAWKARRQAIVEAIKLAEAKRVAAAQKLRAAQDRYEGLPKALQGITHLLSTEFEQERKEIVEAADQRIEGMFKDVEEKIQDERRAAEQKVIQVLSERVLQKTHALIDEKLTREGDAHLRAHALDQMKESLH